MLSYSYPIIGSFDFGSLTIKFYNMTFYSHITNLTNYSFLYSLYLLSLFFWQSRYSLVTYLANF